METKNLESRKRPKRAEAPVAVEPTGRGLVDFLKEKSTWCGLLTIGATFATGGTAAWLDVDTLPILMSGIGLILAKG